jgi:tRNA pseudouridine55 synthase
VTGCLLLNKSSGITSFKSLTPVKKALQTPKVCHTGTLDNFAQGLLVILAHRAVKLSSYFMGCDKQYRAVIRFGEETDTLDPEGKLIAAGPVPGLKELEAALPAFTGTIQQAPPGYSAVHINGKRAYKLAREGIAIEMKKKPVTIHSLSLAAWDPPHAELEIHCSSGTYIRSLARDLAIALGSRAHLRSLIRTKVGNFSLEDAILLSEKEPCDHEETIKTALMPISANLFAKLGIPCIYLDSQNAMIVSHGGDLHQLQKNVPELEKLCGSACTKIALFRPAADGHSPAAFAAVIEKKEHLWKYGFVNAAD